MNLRQFCILFLGVLVFVLMGLFPPVNRVQTLKVVNESSGSEEDLEVQSEFQGYAFYFSMGNPQDWATEAGQEYRVAKIILAAEWLVLLVIVRILMVSFRDKKPSLPKLFHQP
jgi:hypothetical protein